MVKGTLNHPTAVFSTARPRVERTGATRGKTDPVTDHTAKTHDYNMFKSLLDSLKRKKERKWLQHPLKRRTT